MKAKEIARLPLSAAAVVSKDKNLYRNPVLRSGWLNRAGLHRWRVAVAHAASKRRRDALAPRISADERAQFEENGFVVRENALPADLFEALTEELETVPRTAWEMRQGHALTRLMLLPTDKADTSAAAKARRFLRAPAVRALVGYVSGRTGGYSPLIQTIANHPGLDAPDPQNILHADTFHPTAKFWLFMHDVAADEGPLSYVPGSHRLTPERLDWEHAQSIAASEAGDLHEAPGPFRIAEDDLSALGYGPLTSLPVKGNTLVVADTFGFHARTPTRMPTVRTELHAMLRRNPFMPWNGGDLSEVPFVQRRALGWRMAYRDWRAERGRVHRFRNVGLRFAADPSD